MFDNIWIFFKSHSYWLVITLLIFNQNLSCPLALFLILLTNIALLYTILKNLILWTHHQHFTCPYSWRGVSTQQTPWYTRRTWVCLARRKVSRKAGQKTYKQQRLFSPQEVFFTSLKTLNKISLNPFQDKMFPHSPEDIQITIHSSCLASDWFHHSNPSSLRIQMCTDLPRLCG